MTRVLFILALLTMSDVYAETESRIWTGNDLLAYCSALVKAIDSDKPQNSANSSVCGGYLIGFLDGVNAMQAENVKTKNLKKLVCTGSGATVGQFARVLEKFLRDRPEYLNQSSTVLSMVAFSQAFPCD